MRGRRVDLLILDEFGKFPNPEEAWGSALPATESGQLIVIGNANGYGTRFWKLYTAAKAKANNFLALFYSWRVVPGRDDEWLATETSSMLPHERAAEYPDNDEECWITSGVPVFEPEVLNAKVIVRASPGFLRGKEMTLVENGPLRVWSYPAEGERYAIGADTAEGQLHGDYSVAAVLDSRRQLVATLRGRIAAVAFAGLLNDLGRWYNSAPICVERASTGPTVIDVLLNDHRYMNLYRETTFDQVVLRTKVEYGYSPSNNGKRRMIGQLIEGLPEMAIPDEQFVHELKTYRYLELTSNGVPRMGGSPHDDCVAALALANMAWLRLPTSPRPREEQAPGEPSTFADFDGTYWSLARLEDPDEDRWVAMNSDRRPRRLVRR